MAVFLVNQCTFPKLTNVCNDQQNSTNGTSPGNNQNSNDSTSNLSVNNVGLSTSNICGLKFDSLFELIHHIEDNHITGVDYPGVGGYNTHPHQTPHHQLDHLPVPHHPAHMTQIINGGWLPTSCILRISNSTHKPQRQQQPQPQQQTHPQPQPPQPILQPQPQHHIEDNHVTGVDYSGLGGYNTHPHQTPHQQLDHLSAPQHQAHMTQIINGGWLPTNCILHISNPANEPPRQQQQQPQQQHQPVPPSQLQPVQQQSQLNPQSPAQPQLQPQTHLQPQSQSQPLSHPHTQPQPNSQPSPQLQVQPQVQSQTLPISQPPTPAQSQPPPQLQLQLQPQPQPNLHSQSQPQQQPPQPPSQQQQNLIQVTTPNAMPKPAKVYKCSDCSRTYKTTRGLKTHQSTHHSNSPHASAKVVAITPEAGDTPSGSLADVSQQQQQQQPQPQTPQPKQQLQQKQQQPSITPQQ